jgi:hypothetical protein
VQETGSTTGRAGPGASTRSATAATTPATASTSAAAT